tara:strand:+ start:7771 stop:9756 length:1986 start_codon:yes stop_codon:yes gene_type:complete
MKIKVLSNLYDFSRKSRLDPYFWTPSKKLKQYVKEALIQVVKDFLSSVEISLSPKDIRDIQLTGSIANYNYSKYSDIDLHILIDFSKLHKDKKFIKDYFLAKKNNWNNKHKITMYGHEVEIYVQDSAEPHFSSGVYSVKNDKWEKEPAQDKQRAKKSNIICAKRKADGIAYEIDDLVSRADDEDVLEEIEYLKEKIRNMRRTGLERDGEDAVENIAFKILRRRQDLKLLSDLQVSEYDQSVSIQEDQEWWKKRRKEDNLNYRELIGFVKGVKVSKKGGGYKLNPPMKLGISGPPAAFQESLVREATINLDLNSIYGAIDSLKDKGVISIEADLKFGMYKLFGAKLCKKGLKINLVKAKEMFTVSHSPVSSEEKTSCFPSMLEEKTLDDFAVKKLITDLFDDQEIVELTIGGVVYKAKPTVPAPETLKPEAPKIIERPPIKMNKPQIQGVKAYGGVRPSFKSDGTPRERKRDSITSIVLHDTLTSSLHGMLHSAGWAKPTEGGYYHGTHFSIDKSGVVRQHLPIEYKANHTQAGDYNNKSIGIDIITRAGGTGPTNKGWKPPRAAQMDSLYLLVQNLQKLAPSIEDSVFWNDEGPSGGWYTGNKSFYLGNGVVSHGHAQRNRQDGVFAAYYLKLRKDGRNHAAAYKEAVDAERKASQARRAK